MATASAHKIKATQLERRSVTSALFAESHCARCGGLMVNDLCMDLLNSTGELDCAAKRCVQCGEVVDPVIQRNRLLGQESTAFRFPEKMASRHGGVNVR